MISQINTKVNSLYIKVLTFFYKLFYKTLQFPTRNSISKFNNKLVIAYDNKYVITDIELGDDGLFHGTYNYENAIYSLQGATIDLLIQDLIEGSEEESLHKLLQDAFDSIETEGTTSWEDIKKDLDL